MVIRLRYRHYLEHMDNVGYYADDGFSDDPSVVIEQVLSQGGYVSWSKQPLEKDIYLKLIGLVQNREKTYDECVQVLGWASQYRNLREEYMNYYEVFTQSMSELLTYDAQITDLLMDRFYIPHDRGGILYDSYLEYRQLLSHPDYVNGHDITTDDLDRLEKSREDILNAIVQSRAYLTAFPVKPMESAA